MGVGCGLGFPVLVPIAGDFDFCCCRNSIYFLSASAGYNPAFTHARISGHSFFGIWSINSLTVNGAANNPFTYLGGGVIIGDLGRGAGGLIGEGVVKFLLVVVTSQGWTPQERESWLGGLDVEEGLGVEEGFSPWLFFCFSQ